MSENIIIKKKTTVLSPQVTDVKRLLRRHRLHSVCESAHCPNIGDCFGKKTATFLIMGNICTRNCRFCDIGNTSRPDPLDPAEPENLARAVAELGLRYVVITSVTRDDLPDGGAEHFAKTIAAVSAVSPATLVEVLTPDMRGNPDALGVVADARPDVFNHNVETVPRLYGEVRPQADYRRSLRVLSFMKERGLTTKSGLMVGLGETDDEIREVLHDLKVYGCDIATIGQYFRPSHAHLPVTRDLTEEEFAALRAYGLSIGLREVYAGRFVRSSFNAAEVFAATTR
ncbi:MAG TPA: lipoyl synthase [bacterium]|nr:lipoyl synthase [bacterium]